jgi:hypothetical protein
MSRTGWSIKYRASAAEDYYYLGWFSIEKLTECVEEMEKKKDGQFNIWMGSFGTDFKKILEAMTRFHIALITIRYYENVSMETYLECLSQLPHLKELGIRENFPTKEFAELMDGLGRLNIDTLDLHDMHVSEENYPALVQAVIKHPMTSLILPFWRGVVPAGARWCMEMVEHKTDFTSLDFGNVAHDETSLPAFLRALARNTTLKDLKFQYGGERQPTESCTDLIADMITKGTLRYVSGHSCPRVQDRIHVTTFEQVEKLAHAIRDSMTLETLRLQMLHFETDIAIQFMNAIGYPLRLEALNVYARSEATLLIKDHLQRSQSRRVHVLVNMLRLKGLTVDLVRMLSTFLPN